MQGVFFRTHGGPEVLEYGDLPDPSPGPDEVLVKVAACGLNHLDLWVRQGLGIDIPMPHIGGCEVVGTVAALGAQVAGLSVGDRVLVSPGHSCGTCSACQTRNDSACAEYRVHGLQLQGGFAEYSVAPACDVLRISDRWSPAEWAVTPLVFLTAWHMLKTRARLQAGETVLVHGAGSGIGSAAIQLCKHFGCTVVTTAGSQEKLEKARALGADYGINYRTHPAFHKEVRRVLAGRGVDVVFEHIGQATWTSSLASMDPGGRLVFCGTTSGPTVTMDLRFLFVRQFDILGSYMGAKAELQECLKLLEAGVVRPILDTAYPLRETRAAQERMRARNFFGKLAVTV
ncbi:MAG: zinc-binding dehydrogenase [Deltaproteobacteria bacterium]|nr:zinc-binding dehydrogenase [Deltaproteobacteria bacterium]